MSIRGIAGGFAVPIGTPANITEDRNKVSFATAESDRQARKQETQFYMSQLQLPNLDHPFLQKEMEAYSAPLIQRAAQLLEDDNFAYDPKAQMEMMQIKSKLMNNDITNRATQLNGIYQTTKENKDNINATELQKQLEVLNKYSANGYWEDKDGNQIKTAPPFMAQSRAEQKKILGAMANRAATKQSIITDPNAPGFAHITPGFDDEQLKKDIDTYIAEDPVRAAGIWNGFDGVEAYNGDYKRFMFDIAKANASPLKSSVQNDPKYQRDTEIQLARMRYAAENNKQDNLYTQLTSLSANYDKTIPLAMAGKKWGSYSASTLGQTKMKLNTTWSQGNGALDVQSMMNNGNAELDQTEDISFLSKPGDKSSGTGDAVATLWMNKDAFINQLMVTDLNKFRDSGLSTHILNYKLRSDGTPDPDNMDEVLEVLEKTGVIFRERDKNGVIDDSSYGTRIVIPKSAFDETIGPEYEQKYQSLKAYQDLLNAQKMATLKRIDSENARSIKVETTAERLKREAEEAEAKAKLDKQAKDATSSGGNGRAGKTTPTI
jgi:hypothetical protein